MGCKGSPFKKNVSGIRVQPSPDPITSELTKTNLRPHEQFVHYVYGQLSVVRGGFLARARARARDSHIFIGLETTLECLERRRPVDET